MVVKISPPKHTFNHYLPTLAAILLREHQSEAGAPLFAVDRGCGQGVCYTAAEIIAKRLATLGVVMEKDNFEITTQSEADFHVVSIRGVLDVFSESALSNVLDPLCRTGTPRIVIDCRNLHYVNSATFGLFFHYHRLCETQHGRLVLYGLSAKIMSIVKLLGLHQVLNIQASQEEAISNLAAVDRLG